MDLRDLMAVETILTSLEVLESNDQSRVLRWVIEKLELQGKVIGYLKGNPGQSFTVEAIASGIGKQDEVETVFKILQHITANPHHGVKCQSAASPFAATYFATTA